MTIIGVIEYGLLRSKGLSRALRPEVETGPVGRFLPRRCIGVSFQGENW